MNEKKNLSKTIYSKPFKVSVVIPTKNRVNDLKECIESLIKQIYPIFELIIVDGSTNDETERYIKNLKKDKLSFDCIYTKQTKGGLATARNIGNKETRGDIIFHLEDDLILYEDFVKEIIYVFINDTNNEIGAVCGKPEKEARGKSKIFIDILYPIFGIIFFRDSWRKGSVTISGHHASLPNRFAFVEWLLNAAYRKEISHIFKYDLKLETLSSFAYYDDLDFSYRVSKKYKLVVTPKAKYIHQSSLTAHSHINAFKFSSVKIQNHYYLVKKHNFSKIAFWWSTFGLLLSYTIQHFLERSKASHLMFLGLIDGVKKLACDQDL